MRAIIPCVPSDVGWVRSGPVAWWKRVGVFGFLFFAAKGLAWLVAPAVVVLYGCD